jgi:hypothetical protein
MSVATAPIEYKDVGRAMPPTETFPKEATRYVACLGDFITPSDKIQLASLGSRSGGLRLGASDTEGCPTMFRTDYIIRRGCFTPLEKTVITARTDERNINHKPIGEKQALPGNDIALIQDDGYREQGVVEITALRDKEWVTGAAMELNQHFFPDLVSWLKGDKPFPVLLEDYEAFINNARIDEDAHATTQQELLTAARMFRSYGLGQIATNRARIEATKSIDMAGFTIRWSDRTRLFAAQLGVTLEDEREMKNTTVTNTDSVEMIDLKKRELELKERELALKERELGIAPTQEPHATRTYEVAETPATTDDVALAEALAPVVDEIPLEERCTAVKADGEQCTKRAIKDGRCQVPAHQM